MMNKVKNNEQYNDRKFSFFPSFGFFGKVDGANEKMPRNEENN